MNKVYIVLSYEKIHPYIRVFKEKKNAKLWLENQGFKEINGYCVIIGLHIYNNKEGKTRYLEEHKIQDCKEENKNENNKNF